MDPDAEITPVLELSLPQDERAVVRRRPFLLIGERHEWMARSLASVIAPLGFDVAYAFNGPSLLRVARQRHPDLVLLAGKVPGWDGLQLCRNLQALPEIGPAIPIVVLTSLRISHANRMAFLKAGAWDCIQFPEQVPELLAKIETFTRARLADAQGAREAIFDPETGFYTENGVLHRVQSEVEEARMNASPVAALILAPDPGTEAEKMKDPASWPPLVQPMAQVLRSETESTDVLARLARFRFAIVSPSTTLNGATRLAHRLAHQVDVHLSEAFRASSAPVVQVGCYIVEDPEAEEVDGETLLSRAATALSRAHSEGPERRVGLYAPRSPSL